jgi:hypothetical protein
MKVGTMVNEIKADEDAAYAEFAEMYQRFVDMGGGGPWYISPWGDAGPSALEGAADAPTIVDAASAQKLSNNPMTLNDLISMLQDARDKVGGKREVWCAGPLLSGVGYPIRKVGSATVDLSEADNAVCIGFLSPGESADAPAAREATT